MNKLTPPQIDALRAMATEPFHMASAWEGNGHRRQLFFFANVAGDIRLPLPLVTGLAAAGLATMEDDPRDPENLIVRASASGEMLILALDVKAA